MPVRLDRPLASLLKVGEEDATGGASGAGHDHSRAGKLAIEFKHVREYLGVACLGPVSTKKEVNQFDNAGLSGSVARVGIGRLRLAVGEYYVQSVSEFDGLESFIATRE